MMHKQKGFTLIESLIVLSIFMILTLITTMSIKPQYFIKDDELFIEQLSADLYFAQAYAISHQSETYLAFKESEYQYIIKTSPDQPPLLERQYSNRIKAYGGTLSLYVKYLPDGNISKFGSFYISIGEKLYKYTFLIGKGRFYVTQEK